MSDFSYVILWTLTINLTIVILLQIFLDTEEENN